MEGSIVLASEFMFVLEKMKQNKAEELDVSVTELLTALNDFKIDKVYQNNKGYI